jgi:hypothetical protein
MYSIVGQIDTDSISFLVRIKASQFIYNQMREPVGPHYSEGDSIADQTRRVNPHSRCSCLHIAVPIIIADLLICGTKKWGAT